jgi:2-iminobutanoate/2-iminopropanoate deaminase
MKHATNKVRNFLVHVAVACAAIGICAAGDVALAQDPAKTKLAPPEVFQLPFPYSQGIAAQGKRLIFVAGQIAIDEKGALVGKDDPEAQARQVFKNIKAVLESAGASMDRVVKITMIVKNAADFPKIGAVRREVFKEPYPASTTFVAALLNPDWLVEVEAFAVLD